MRKHVMALAVAGALAAPAAALAQVQIYGVFNAEYGFVDQPNDGANVSREKADALNSGASRIGLREQENLGGGLAAWAQCESQLNVFGTSFTPTGWCGRNSAVGLKGGFGNFFVGKWDSPYKIASGTTRMLNESGWLGAQNVLMGDQFDFSLRNSASLNYSSPDFGGFSFNVQTTTTNAALDATSGSSTKGRRSSIGGQFASGPLVVVGAYVKHDDNAVSSNFLGGALGDEETAWLAGVTYQWGQWKGGLTYANNKAEDNTGASVERNSWNLAVDFDLPGPGLIRAGYTQAGDYEGSGGAPAGTDTGAKQWQIGYIHSFSKRTNVGIAYVKLDNDNNGTYNLTNLDSGAGNVFPGDGASAVVVNLTHTF